MKLSPEVEAKVLSGATHVNGVVVTGPVLRCGHKAAVEVPLPPSVNHLFVTRGRRRFKSPEYRAWLAAAVPLLAALVRPERLPVEITVLVLGKVNNSRDLDNLLKPLGDAVVRARVIPGDSVKHVRRWSVEYVGDGTGEAVAVVAVRPVATTEGAK